jgi:hypothetical protein
MIDLIPGNLDRFLAEDDGKPVTMLNLLRFKPAHPSGAGKWRSRRRR